MINFIKIHMLFCNLLNKQDKPANMTSREKHYADIEDPSFWDWVNYAFCLPIATTGPSAEYKDVTDWLNLKGAHKNMKPGSHLGKAFKRYG